MSHSRQTFWSVAIEHLRKGLERCLEDMYRSSGFYLADLSYMERRHIARIPASHRVIQPRPSRSTLRRQHHVQRFGSSLEKRSCVVSDRAQDFVRTLNLPH
jgi:hypothetical protein